MPTPEQLGVAPVSLADGGNLDWTAVHDKLDRLGAVCFRLDKLDGGGCRFVCFLPTPHAGITHRVDAEAASAADAVRLVLTQAEQWVRNGK